MSKPHFSNAAENNKAVILEQLRKNLKDGDKVLEIASGTAQHALHFSEQMPGITWQPSDVDLEQFDLASLIAAPPRTNLLPPLQIDVSNWPDLTGDFDAVYSANCIHIIDWPKVEPYIAGAAKHTKPCGLFMLYGPFKYGGAFTTPSNAQFNEFLEQTYPGGGIRDFEAVDDLAKKYGFSFESDTSMPANNQFLVWRMQAIREQG